MELSEGGVAVVTGAASGLGLAFAEALLTKGMHVALADVDDARLLHEVARLGRVFGAERVAGLPTDVADASSVEALAREVMVRFGPVRLLCNNAGLLDSGRSWERSVAAWQRILRTNIEGVVHGITAFVPAMVAAGESAHVVNVSSTTAFEPRPGLAPYSASKAAVLSISETLAMELDALGAPVGVSVILPGGVATRLTRDISASPRDTLQTGQPAAPGLRQPDDIAAQMVKAIEQGQFYVFTHPERFAGLQARVEQTLCALGEGDEQRLARPTPPRRDMEHENRWG